MAPDRLWQAYAHTRRHVTLLDHRWATYCRARRRRRPDAMYYAQQARLTAAIHRTVRWQQALLARYRTQAGERPRLHEI